MKKNILIINYMLIFFIILYFGFEAKNLEILNAYSFYQLYFDNFTKILFIGTLFIILIIYTSQVRYLNPEVKIRMKNNVFDKVWTSNLIYMFLTIIVIIGSFIVSSVIFGYENVFSIINMKSLLRICLFIFMCFVIKEIIYLNTKNIFLSAATVIAVNFTFSVMMISINFYMYGNGLTEEQLLNILEMSSSLIIFIGMIYLYRKMDKKEILK